FRSAWSAMSIKRSVATAAPATIEIQRKTAEVSDQSARPTVQILLAKIVTRRALESSNVSGSLLVLPAKHVRLAQIGIEFRLPRIGAKNASDRPALAGLYIAAATCRLSVARIETTRRSSWSWRWPAASPTPHPCH